VTGFFGQNFAWLTTRIDSLDEFLIFGLISGIRLVQSKRIKKEDFWKNFIPFWNDKYWTFLFFNK
jgi:hypothetical protein